MRSSRSRAGIDGGAIEHRPQDARLRQRHVEARRRGAIRRPGRLRRDQAEARIGGEEDDEIADVDHATRVVERVLINRQARVPGGAEQVQHFPQRRVERERDDVGARDHDIGDPDIVQGQNVLEDRAFLGREFGAVALVDRVLDVVANRSRREAEQRAQTFEQAGRLFPRGWRGAASLARDRCRLLRSSLDDSVRIGIGDPEPRQNPPLERLHALRPLRPSGDRSRSDAKSHAPRDGDSDRRAARPVPPPRAPASRRRARCRRAWPVERSLRRRRSGNESTLVGWSMPRHRALSARTSASSVRRRLTSDPARESSPHSADAGRDGFARQRARPRQPAPEGGRRADLERDLHRAAAECPSCPARS